MTPHRIERIDRIVAALDPDAAGAGQALLAATVAIGFDEAVARAGIQAELEAWQAPGAAVELIRRLPPAGRAPGAVLVIGARTLPVSTLRQVLIGRLIGARVFVKAARGQEAIAEALARADAEIVAAPFAPEDGVAVRAALRTVEAVVVLGSDQTVEAVRREIVREEGGQTFVGYGHRVSAAWMGPEVSDAEVVGLAEDVAAWDGAGCLAPKVIWSEGPARALAERLGRALAEVTAELPLSAAGTHQLRAARVEAIMRGGEAFVGARYGVGVLARSVLVGVPAPRWVWVVPADARALAAAASVLSTLAVGGRPEQPLSSIVGAAASHVRACGPGEMQRPTLAWRQDGYDPIAAIWIDTAL